MRITCVNQTIKKLQKARSESYSCIYICQSKAFETLFCIFVPWIWIRTGRAQRLYTLSTHSVLKYLYNPKLLILTPHHFSIQEKECTRKAGAKRENKISEKKLFLFHDYCLFVVLYKNDSLHGHLCAHINYSQLCYSLALPKLSAWLWVQCWWGTGLQGHRVCSPHRASMSLWAGLSLISVPRGVVRLGEPGRAPSVGMSGGGALRDAVGGVLFRIPFWWAVAAAAAAAAAAAEGLTLE